MSYKAPNTKSAVGIKRKTPEQPWSITAGALHGALTRIDGALSVLERLAEAIEEHLGMFHPNTPYDPYLLQNYLNLSQV